MNKKLRNAVFIPVAAASAVSVTSALSLYHAFMHGNHEIKVSEENVPAQEEVSRLSSPETWSFVSFDGLKLKAFFYPCPAHLIPDSETFSHKYAICVHGYHGCYTDMMPYAAHYLKEGYNVLMPMLRGHGLSEGDYVAFGYYDHYDIMGYIDLIREKDPKAVIILHGISMGAAAVMMTAGEMLPDNVKAAVEDAGFTSAYEQCRYNLRTQYHLPAFPVLTMTNALIRMRLHYSLTDAEPIEYVKHATLPILFIHGDQDDFVPFRMQKPLYDACTSEKDILTVHGAAHVKSVFVDPEAYWQKTDAFLSNYVK